MGPGMIAKTLLEILEKHCEEFEELSRLRYEEDVHVTWSAGNDALVLRVKKLAQDGSTLSVREYSLKIENAG